VAVFYDRGIEFVSTLRFPGAAVTVVLSPKSTYRRAREMYVDIFALAFGPLRLWGFLCFGSFNLLNAGDFFILANSTFSFWAQFFSRCRRELLAWWTVPFPKPRAAHALEIYVNPYRQDKIAEDGQRSSTFELINGPYLYPRTVPLFEEDLGIVLPFVVGRRLIFFLELTAWNAASAKFYGMSFESSKLR
jgi:hypothetical protein